MSGKSPRASHSKSIKLSAATTTTAELDATTADQTTAATLATTARDIETRIIVNPFDVMTAETTDATAETAPIRQRMAIVSAETATAETARLATLRADTAKLAAETADPTADAQRAVDAQLTADRIATAETATTTAETAAATAPPEVLAAVGRVNGAWDFVAVSAAPAHLLAADPTAAPATAPDVMTADQKIATHRAGMATLAVASARFVDNANLTAQRMDEGRGILAHAEWYRTAFPNSWTAATLDVTIIGEIVTNAMRFVDKAGRLRHDG